MNTTSTVSFTDVEDQLISRWLFACQAQLSAQDEDTRERWAEVAHAWAQVARETPWNARQDLCVYWNLAATAAKKARR